MPGYKNIAVAGATGNLGPTIVQELVAADFNVTVLSQSGKSDNLPSGVKVIKIDYSSHDSLVEALKDQEAFVSLIPDFDSQPKLIDAAIAAGVKRFLPSEFGSDTLDEKVRTLPVFKGKLDTQAYLKSKESEISWSIIVNGLFLDWGIQIGFWANVKTGPTTIFDNGDAKHSSTTLSDIGKAVAGVLNKPEETKNRVLYVQSAAVSQNQILAIAQKKNPGFKPEIVNVKTEDVLESCLATFGKGPGPGFVDALQGLIAVAIFSESYSNLWSEKNDNELLGIKGLSEEEFEDVVARYV
jgi:uncharacterized protein YbjT (DUF2867 family)